MKRVVLASLFALVVATPALAAGEEYYLVKDTVGNCSAVIGGKTGPGLTVQSEKGYTSLDTADKALGDLKGCKGLVE